MEIEIDKKLNKMEGLDIQQYKDEMINRFEKNELNKIKQKIEMEG